MFLLLLVTFNADAQFSIFNGTREAPTMDNCGCKKLVAFKRTKSTTKEGTVTVYKDLLSFSFGTYTQRFFHIEGKVWSDEDGDIYLLSESEDGGYYLKVGSTFYIIRNEES